ncbi:MAG: DUF4364 family protein [Clostridia bacterium]|nr:DUF4364 family protein [Clostridia bacterium]
MYENKEQLIQNEILILYILDNIDVGLSEAVLTDFVMKPGLINYFSYKESLDRLLSGGYVSKLQTNDGGEIFNITDSGRVSCRAMSSVLSQSLRNPYDDLLEKEKDKLSSAMTVNAYTFIDANKNLSVRCFIREKGNLVVDLRLPVPDSETGQQICESWKKNAFALLPKIILAASGEL